MTKTQICDGFSRRMLDGLGRSPSAPDEGGLRREIYRDLARKIWKDLQVPRPPAS